MSLSLADVHVQSLILAPEFFSQVAAWHHQECERQGLKSSLALRQQRLQLHVQHNKVPQTLVALHRGDILGCVSLVNYQVGVTRKDPSDVSPVPIWLSNLFVRENMREQGVGSLLIAAAVNYVSKLHEQELWLSAAEYTAFYQKRGWQITRRTRLGGRQVNIMKREGL